MNTSNVSQKGSVTWQSPSNIAIVKYWGKHGRQLPRNASISFTLSEAHTNTSVSFESKEDKGIDIDFLFEGVRNEAFQKKIEKFLTAILDEMPWLEDYKLSISSSNSFPHSSGIASSASAMSALVMCLCDIEKIIGFTTTSSLLERASYFSRLGSGSASRSVFSTAAMWGHHPDIANSSDLFAIGLQDIHPIFQDFHDDIMIISSDEKSVSSTAGHKLMEGNPYATARYQQANDRLVQLKEILSIGDVSAFGKILEDEAMSLHALMMCSDPSYVLIKPNTLVAIDAIRSFREEQNIPVYFTLDAGPNIHLMYPDDVASEVAAWRDMVLRPLCVDGRIILDKVGNGPIKLK